MDLEGHRNKIPPLQGYSITIKRFDPGSHQILWVNWSKNVTRASFWTNNEKLALYCLCPIIWSYKFRDHLHSFLILITLSLFYLSMRYWSMHDNRGYQQAYNFHQFPAKFRIIFSEIYTAVSPWNKNEWEKSIVHNSSCSFFYDQRWK